ncbi:MAG TPA: L,D-transpeptidase family protein [Gemmatimonadaceae bacterium]|jgi:D-alanyl-D-alanine dipeptidase|nr:L,D-transpeptidase family protein [Gemmatimonadaceae bacterium]
MSVNVDALVDGSQQIVIVTTPDWTATRGTMRRFERGGPSGRWRAIDSAVPVVVGRTGLAWGVGFDHGARGDPHKHEGDGKSPAGVFPLDTVFGFAPRDAVVKLPYVQLAPTTDCVDDIGSAHYNTVVDRAAVERVDWSSAEHMREVPQYRNGVIVGYNATPPVKGRGSCIFLHIWAGPDSHTAGCTAFDETKLREVINWLDPKKRPLLVQLTASDYARLRSRWDLPSVQA